MYYFEFFLVFQFRNVRNGACLRSLLINNQQGHSCGQWPCLFRLIPRLWWPNVDNPAEVDVCLLNAGTQNVERLSMK
jgi:hypothetical protein